MTIQSISVADTEKFFLAGQLGKKIGWAGISITAWRKLDMIHYATRLDGLKAPPGNRLESSSGDIKGFHSIRIKEQWHIVFRWTDAGPYGVRIADHH